MENTVTITAVAKPEMGAMEMGTAADVGLVAPVGVLDGTLEVLLAARVATELTPAVAPRAGAGILVFPGSTDVTTTAVVRVNGYVRVTVVLGAATCKVVLTVVVVFGVGVGVGVMDDDGMEDGARVVMVIIEE